MAFREFSRTLGGSLFAGRLNCSTPLGLCNILVDHLLSEGDARLTVIHPTEKVGTPEACAGETTWSRSGIQNVYIKGRMGVLGVRWRAFHANPPAGPKLDPGFLHSRNLPWHPVRGWLTRAFSREPWGRGATCPASLLAQTGTTTWEGQPASHVSALL